MAKFRYYITNTYSGMVEGTNSEDRAEEIAGCEDYFVVDSQTGEWLHSDGHRVPVKEVE